MKRLVTLAATAALAFSIAACGSGSDYHVEQMPVDPNYVGVCVNDDGLRVDDSYCQKAPAYSNGYASGGIDDFVWGYFLASALMPRYNAPVGSTIIYRVDERTNNVYRGGVPRDGGKLNLNSYKPQASKVVKPDMAVNSQKYKDVRISADSTYKQKKSDSNVYKAPAQSNQKNPPMRQAPAPARRGK